MPKSRVSRASRASQKDTSRKDKSRKSMSRKSRKIRKAAKKNIKTAKHDEVSFDETQTVVFNKSDWELKEAKDWLKEHGYKYGKVDEKKNTYRFRQFDPHYGNNWDYAYYKIKSASKGLPILLGLNFNANKAI